MTSGYSGLLLAALASISVPLSAAPDRPVIVAHRGVSQGMPENTLASFARSVERGIAVIEVDVRTTRDGQLVLLHDATLGRTTDCGGRVARVTLARIKSCDAGGPTHPGERVPTLAEALDFIAATPSRLLLDIKPGTRLDDVIREIRGHHAEAKVVLGLRSTPQIARARRELPNTTLLAFIPMAADVARFARSGVDAVRLWSDWVAADPKRVGRARALGPEVWIMIGRKRSRNEAQGRALHARMLAANPDALITDHPELIEDR